MVRPECGEGVRRACRSRSAPASRQTAATRSRETKSTRGRSGGARRPQPGDNGCHQRDEQHPQILHERDEADVGAVGRGHQHHRRCRAGRGTPHGGGARQHAPAREQPAERAARRDHRDDDSDEQRPISRRSRRRSWAGCCARSCSRSPPVRSGRADAGREFRRRSAPPELPRSSARAAARRAAGWPRDPARTGRRERQGSPIASRPHDGRSQC